MDKTLFSKVYLWLFIGLLVTFGTGVVTSQNKDALEVLFVQNRYWIFAVAEVAIALYLSIRIQKMSPTAARICYLLYTFLTGLTFSTIFIAYKITSIIMVFGVTSALFLAFALIGAKTNVDLTKFRTYFFMALIGMIICTIINLFLRNPMFDILICCASIVIFLGYIAYDIQRIKSMEGVMDDDKVAVFMAFQLFLDFINVFMDLLRLFGDTRD